MYKLPFPSWFLAGCRRGCGEKPDQKNSGYTKKLNKNEVSS